MQLKGKLTKITKRMQSKLMPNLRYCQAIYEEMLAAEVSDGMDWLDLGCGWHILPEWRIEAEARLVGMPRLVAGVDFDLDSLQKHRSIRCRIRGDLRVLPLKSESFDLITSNMVLEHVEDPSAVFGDVARVLRPGGRFLFHTPSIYGYATMLGRLVPEALKPRLIELIDDRVESDVFETHYRVNSPRAIREVAKRSGLELVKLRTIVSTVRLRFAPPLALAELALTRVLMMDAFKGIRPNIIALLQKRQA